MKAAEQGEALAQANLGLIYARGRGVPQDYRAAMGWYLKAAEQGDASSQNNIGYMYHYGHGAPKNLIYAFAWYSISSEQGSKVAAANRQIVIDLFDAEELEKGKKLSKEYYTKYVVPFL